MNGDALTKVMLWNNLDMQLRETSLKFCFGGREAGNIEQVLIV